jgi:hypothetical protein
MRPTDSAKWVRTLEGCQKHSPAERCVIVEDEEEVEDEDEDE